jgi:hypothetical protein
MKLTSILELISKRLDKIVLSDSNYNIKSRSAKRIKSLEKNILSQGDFGISNYQKLTNALYANNIYISSKAINDSVRSRIRTKNEFYPLNEILSSSWECEVVPRNWDKVDLNVYSGLDFVSLNELEIRISKLHEIDHLDIQNSLYADLYVEFLRFIDEVEADLKYKRLISLLIDLKSKTNQLLKTYIQIPIIASFLEFFDQVFTLKDYEIDNNDFHNSFNINVKTNNYYHGREIHRFIPITS